MVIFRYPFGEKKYGEEIAIYRLWNDGFLLEMLITDDR